MTGSVRPDPTGNAWDGRSLDALRRDSQRMGSGSDDQQRKVIRQAAQQVESVFLEQLVKQMRAALPQSDPLTGPGQDVMRSMLDQKMAAGLSQRGLGLADAIARQLERAVGLGADQKSAGKSNHAAGDAATPAARSVMAQLKSNTDAANANPNAREASTLQRFRPDWRAPLAGEASTDAGSARAAALRALDQWRNAAQRTALGELDPSAPNSDPAWDRMGSDGANPAFDLAGEPAASVEQLGLRPAAAEIYQRLKSAGAAVAAPATEREDLSTALGTSSEVPRAFVQRLWGEAKSAEQATGVPAQFILGQAALETGWGRKQITSADGRPSYNMFGIKAGSQWKGATVDSWTTEYVNGKAQRVVERFRAYGSYEEAFKDYANLLTDNPRFAQTLSATANPADFARSLQRAGYATDPNYAAKLVKTIERTLREAV